jgi:hypothetical protein
MDVTHDSPLPQVGDVVRISRVGCGCDGSTEPCGLHHFEGCVAVVECVAPGVLDDVQRYHLRGIGVVWFGDELEVLVPAVAGDR